MSEPGEGKQWVDLHHLHPINYETSFSITGGSILCSITQEIGTLENLRFYISLISLTIHNINYFNSSSII